MGSTEIPQIIPLTEAQVPDRLPLIRSLMASIAHHDWTRVTSSTDDSNIPDNHVPSDEDKPSETSLHTVTYCVSDFQALTHKHQHSFEQAIGQQQVWQGPSWAVLAISPGFTSCADKYPEFAWYMLSAGIDVIVVEHRGHGYSLRETSDLTSVHIRDWHCYISDFAQSCLHAYEMHHLRAPLCVWGHSMGGAIATGVVEEYPNLFSAAVFSSPMYLPRTGVPTSVTHWLARRYVAAGKAEEPALGKREFDSAMAQEEENVREGKDRGSRSAARQHNFREVRKSKLVEHTLNPTWGWVDQALNMDAQITSTQELAKVKIPVLLMTAGKDAYVDVPAQKKVAQKAHELGLAFKAFFFPGARHELFYDIDPIVKRYMNLLVEFYWQATHPAEAK
ncbi:alpha/beta fold hydrolase [Aeriscardovia aeriphila]|nr:alpha/beta hydrolase [Aeriscardovia aeriphila]NYI25450.1 lysophospholipase [Aeriscardovia aeriphila]